MDEDMRRWLHGEEPDMDPLDKMIRDKERSIKHFTEWLAKEQGELDALKKLKPEQPPEH